MGRALIEVSVDLGAPRDGEVALWGRLVSLLEMAYVYPTGIYIEPPMTRSTVFTTNRSQAVRLPKPVAFPADVRQVEIIRIGQSRLVSPIGRRWDDLFLHGPRATADFLSEREQPKAEKREPL